MDALQPQTAGLLLAALLPAPAAAAELVVEVTGLRNAEGTVHAAVCSEAEFLRPACSRFGSAPAAAPTIVIDVPPGTWAIQVVHDENDNRMLDRPGFLPAEGLGFSRDAPMRMGPPRWSDAAFALGEEGARATVTMRYFR